MDQCIHIDGSQIVLPPNLKAPPFAQGTVWLVGAGPGDPGLLTLHAVNALHQADVILHDALVSPDILAMADKARLESVGKRARGLRMPQLRINQRLIQLARQSLRVVRLKGGDPLVFGRGGEEALALAAAGIPFRIVPGISAGIGGTAAAGIPLTHRGFGRTATFVTGHDSSGALTAKNWASISHSADTLVLYMAQRHIGEIARRLIAHGRAPDENVAVISNATRPDQLVRSVTLATVEAAVDDLPASGSTLFVIGQVVALRPLLMAWQQSGPMIFQHDNEPVSAKG